MQTIRILIALSILGAASAQTCADDAAFRDEKGWKCSGWAEYDCRKAVENHAYSQAGEDAILASCRCTCKECSSSTGACAAGDGGAVAGGAVAGGAVAGGTVAGGAVAGGAVAGGAVAGGAVAGETDANEGVAGGTVAGGALAGGATGCVDTPFFRDEKDWKCSGWTKYNCHEAVENHDYSQAGEDAVIANCPASCNECSAAAGGTVVGAAAAGGTVVGDVAAGSTQVTGAAVDSTCRDEDGFKDEKDWTCSSWKPNRCRLAVENHGYTQAGEDAVLANCPASCQECSGATEIVEGVGGVQAKEIAAPAAAEVEESSPCEEALKRCGRDFTGTCAAGQKLANPDKECEGGICTIATCCEAKLCDRSQTDVLCVGQWYPKAFSNDADYQLSELGSSNCPAGRSMMDSLAECKRVAAVLKVSFIKEMNSTRYPHGCFQCVSSTECRALQDTVPLSQTKGLYWNDSPRSLVAEVSNIRHTGIRKPCKLDPPGCAATGCSAQSCCLPMTCGTNFKSSCLPGELVKSSDTVCNQDSTVQALNCSRTDCCEQKTCSKATLAPVCTNGSVIAPEKSTALCDASGCTKERCCREELCGTDFKGTCGPGETLLPKMPCMGKGCTQETCCGKKTCSDFQCPNDCSLQWLKKRESIYCLSSGCTATTCCEVPLCMIDFKGSCGAGEVPAEKHTLCPGGTCTSDVCCVPKTCDTFQCSGAGMKLKPAGTLCSGDGCNAQTCCDVATCGTDFPLGGCGPWATPRAHEQVCASGYCDKKTCCEKKECVIRNAACNVEKIKGTESFNVYDTKFPNANNNADAAEGACASLDRSECFATMDVNCDGSELVRCMPNHANDPSSILLRPSTTSCVCYRPEQHTCGYNMEAGASCGAGEKVKFYEVCGDDTGRPCDTSRCCEPLTCKTSFFQCALGSKMTDEDALCPKGGCTTESCCRALTCSADFGETCPDHTTAAPGDTQCISGVCSASTCCLAGGATPPPPPKDEVCGTDYHGACVAGEEFMPNVPCGKQTLNTDSTGQAVSASSCSRETCCRQVGGNLMCADSFTGCTAETGLAPRSDSIMCSSSGCTTDVCCRPTTCADFFNPGTNTGSCGANEIQLPMTTPCNGQCSADTCCKLAPTTPAPEESNPCTTAAPPPPVVITKDVPVPVPAPAPAPLPPVKIVDTTSTWYYEPTRDGTAVKCGAPNSIWCASDDGNDCNWGVYTGTDPYGAVSGVPATVGHMEVPCPGFNQDVDACDTLGCYAETTPPPPPPADPATCGHTFALGAKDSKACPSGYQVIETVEQCVEGAQYLQIQPSDVNGDGTAVNIKDTQAMTAFLQNRVIRPHAALGAQKPQGCYKDETQRTMKGKEQTITTIWLNLRVGGTSKVTGHTVQPDTPCAEGTSGHDNSSPICVQVCDTTVPALQKKFDKHETVDTRQQRNEGPPVTGIGALAFAGFLALAAGFYRHQRRIGRGHAQTRSFHPVALEPQDDGDLDGSESNYVLE